MRNPIMTTEELIQWKPPLNIAPQYKLESFFAHGKDIKLILKEVKQVTTQILPKKITVFFSNSVIHHKITNESLRISADNPATDITGQPLYAWPFYLAINSRLIGWLQAGAYKTKQQEDQPLLHFICVDIESYIEIVAKTEPEIE